MCWLRSRPRRAPGWWVKARKVINWLINWQYPHLAECDAGRGPGQAGHEADGLGPGRGGQARHVAAHRDAVAAQRSQALLLCPVQQHLHRENWTINQGFGIRNTDTDQDPDPDPIRIRNQGFYDKKFKQIYSWKKIFGIKTTVYLSLDLRKGRPSYKKRLQLSKENIQHFKTWNFLIFSTFEGHFCPSGSGSRSRFRIRNRIQRPDWIRIQSGSETLL